MPLMVKPGSMLVCVRLDRRHCEGRADHDVVVFKDGCELLVHPATRAADPFEFDGTDAAPPLHQIDHSRIHLITPFGEEVLKAAGEHDLEEPQILIEHAGGPAEIDLVDLAAQIAEDLHGLSSHLNLKFAT